MSLLPAASEVADQTRGRRRRVAAVVAGALVVSVVGGLVFRDRVGTRGSAGGTNASMEGAAGDGGARTAPLHKYSVPMGVLPPASALAPGVLRVLLLGDSQAKFLGTTLRHVQDDTRVFVAERGVGSCNIFAPAREEVDGGWEESSSCSERWASDVAELRPDVTFVVMGGAFFTDRACDPQFRVEYTRRLSDLVAAMGERAGKLVVARVPYPLGRWRYGDVFPKQVDCVNGILTDFARAHMTPLPMIDLMKHVCPTPACRQESDGAPIRPDGLHFDGRGAHETAQYTLNELLRIAGRARDADTNDASTSPSP